ncbi:hypothetical protein ACH5RR_026322 [Cinchona calisaya]|uniref:Uncharacterized protein n=1 Tax=Cinchona calisaya TaxID=153742 RepID=A0ABD2Z288_9GENT
MARWNLVVFKSTTSMSMVATLVGSDASDHKYKAKDEVPFYVKRVALFKIPVQQMQDFDSPSDDLNNAKIPSTEFKNEPDGGETRSRVQDGNIWEMTQIEEDILLHELECRIAFNEFQECIIK